MWTFLKRLLKRLFGMRGDNPVPRNTQPLSNVDAAWLGMDDPTNLMMITGVMTFKKPLNRDHLMAVLEHRWLSFDRFRQRLVRPTMPSTKPYWETDPYFNLDSHFHHIALPQPGGQPELQQMVSDLMSTPLDFSKPLWQFHLVENYGQGSAIIARMHHSIADGLALIYVLLSLTDMTPDAPWPEPLPVEEEDEDGGLLGGTLGSLFRQSRTAVNAAGSLSGRAVRGSWSTIRNPNRALDLMQSGADVSYATSRLFLRSDDPQTPFKGQLGSMKRGAWSRPLSLHDIKRIKNGTRTTVNDVLVSAMTGALRSYMLEQRETPVDFRATVPVNMRTPEEMGELGNKFGLVFLSLPVSIADPLDRLAEVHLRMEELKRSSEAGVILAALNVVGLSVNQIQDLVVAILAKKATAVLTNVPGPPIPLFLAGREIADLMFWVPQAGRLGIGISILSYAGKVYMGVATDAKLVRNPDRVIEHFYAELDLLLESIQSPPRPAKSAAKGVSPASTTVDDLTQIEGVSKDTAELLNKLGIVNFKQLGQSDGTTLREKLKDAGSPDANADPANWPAQARYLSRMK
jgi:WS/DGAT/MGAT family acyltransferase